MRCTHEDDLCAPTGSRKPGCYKYYSRNRASMPSYPELKGTRSGQGGMCYKCGLCAGHLEGFLQTPPY